MTRTSDLDRRPGRRTMSIARAIATVRPLAAPIFASALLLLVAMPVFADAGPHQALVNSGASTLTADSCAGCHRAHTAQGEYLLAAQTEQALCLSCHGNGGVGATTDVEWGIQYKPTASNARPTVQFNILSVTTGTGLITTSAAHGFVVGQTVTITGVGGLTNGGYLVVESSGATFKVAGPVPTNATYGAGAAIVTGSNPGAVLGALRGGGFVRAALDSGNAARRLVGNDLSYSDKQWAKVRVLADVTGAVAPAPVTSAHLNLTSNSLTAPTVAWGNGPIGLGLNGPGPVVTLDCTTCHNPHGNGQYRILNPIPGPLATSGTFTPSATSAPVADSPVDNPDPAESDTKNYTVIQVRGSSPTTLAGYLLYADDVIDLSYGPTTGDYWHVRVPWNQAATSQLGSDAPNGIPVTRSGGFVGFNTQMTAWCTSCHTRYYELDGDTSTGDSLFAFRHKTTGQVACTTCHVSHGSNARMGGFYSASQPFPNGDAPLYSILGATGDSRLLKVDNRGTCQMCHDPTGLAYPTNPYSGPSPSPGVP